MFVFLYGATKRVLPIIIITCMTIGCGPVLVNILKVPEGKTAEQQRTDNLECGQLSQVTYFPFLFGLGIPISRSIAEGRYDDCMESKGYVVDRGSRSVPTTGETGRAQVSANNAQVDQTSAEFKQKKSNLLDTVNKSKEKLKAICVKPEYAVIFVKSPCLVTDITFEQIADNTKITPEQKAILPKYRTEVETISKELNESFRTSGLQDVILWADYIDSIRTEIDKNNLDLLNGVITWGEYNQRRKEHNARTLAKLKEISQPKH